MSDLPVSLIEKLKAEEWFPEGYGGDGVIYTEHVERIIRQHHATQPSALLNDISAISAMIGYCQSLKVGTVITDDYMKRMNEYYVPRLESIIAAAITQPGIQEPQRDTRKTFEIWAAPRYYDLHYSQSDGYTSKSTVDAWIIWQAAKAAMGGQVDSGAPRGGSIPLSPVQACEISVKLRTYTTEPVTDAELVKFKNRLMATLLDDDRDDAVFIARILTRLKNAEEALAATREPVLSIGAVENEIGEYLQGYETLSKHKCKSWAMQLVSSVIKPWLMLAGVPYVD